MKSIKLSCPSCETVVSLDTEKVSARTRCPNCGTVIRVPSRRAAPHRRTRTRPRRLGRPTVTRPPPVRKVRLGLLVLLVVTAVSLLAALVGQFMMTFAVGWLIKHVWTGSGFVTLFIVWTACEMAATLTAYVLLGFTPRRYAPRALIVTVIILATLTDGAAVVVFTYVARTIFADGASVDAILGMQRLTLFMIPVQILGALQVILLPLFLRQVSQAMEDARSAHLCEMIVKWTAISLGLQLAGPVLALLPLRIIMTLAGLLGLAGFVLSSATRAAYIYVAFSLREGIADHAHRLRPRRKKRGTAKRRAAAETSEADEEALDWGRPWRLGWESGSINCRGSHTTRVQPCRREARVRRPS